MAKCIHLFSDGLDSLVSLKLLEKLGVEVIPVRFFSLFFPLRHHRSVEETKSLAKKRYGIDLKCVDITDDAVEMVKAPRFGYGGCMNPCIDCKILMFKKAGEMMRSAGADFISTGEVVGQRPMTQFHRTLLLTEKESGLEGYILRPLSAKLLKPTVAEQKGLIDREKLQDISGRSRRRQLILTEELGIKEYPQPAGGCLLTDENYSQRLKDLFIHGYRSLAEIEILRIGRHFRMKEAKLVVGRNESENSALDRLRPNHAVRIEPKEVMGPTALLFGKPDEETLMWALKITARYCDSPYEQPLIFKV
ncbi:MAG: tRNA 4-thiouridine(8) synthase ThiI, partial [Planctomycetota bacterium]|nr:tRNA 4-thiouridine(8) synthase ThiI [Planctomycetota bacterium]